MVAIVIAAAQPAGAIDNGFRGRYRVIARGACAFQPAWYRVRIRYVSERVRTYDRFAPGSGWPLRYVRGERFPWQRQGGSLVELRYDRRTDTAVGILQGPQCPRLRVRLVPIGSETVPTQTAPPAAPASAAPDVVSQERCSNGAEVRLELTDTGSPGPIEMRFELHRSPVGHTWHIRIEHSTTLSGVIVEFEGTKATMGDSGHLVVHRPHIRDRISVDEFRAEAFDTQTGQVCRVVAEI